tara:strand:+ start:285 stop:1505 length:1221 start_codon:yes stop_codon:yes gene_type:complete
MTYNLKNCGPLDLTLLYKESDDHKTLLDTLKLTVKYWRRSDKIYKILKYDKQYLTEDKALTIGLFRSVICRNEKIIVFSPPKGIEFKTFSEKYSPNDCIAQEYIEGTMINMFYDQNEWEIATRSSVGGNIYFFNTTNNPITFRTMFLEACNTVNLDFDKLDKNLCYSFILQHPKNRIVIPFTTPNIYLVACYSINNYVITEIPCSSQKEHLSESTIEFPKEYDFTNFNELQEKWLSSNADYKNVGIMLHHSSGVRSKIRNNNYETVRRLRGNQPKIQYRYLVLRNQGKVRDYLKYYPEDEKNFTLFRRQVHNFTNLLHTNYIKCYIKKNAPLIEFPYQYRSHMFQLHQEYINKYREKGDTITRNFVINYINNMHPAKLMYSLNYHLRKNIQDINIINKQFNSIVKV